VFSHRISVADILLDWPLDFRVFLLALVAGIVCTAAMLVLSFVSRWEARATGTSRSWAIAVRFALSSWVVGVLYIPAIYAIAYFRVPGGPHNLLWMLGIPMAVGLMGWPRRSGLAWGMALTISGWFCLWLVSLTVDVPLD